MRQFFSRFFPRLFSVKQIEPMVPVELTVSKVQYDSLLDKATALLAERNAAQEELLKFEAWKVNPMAVLEHFLPGLHFEPFNYATLPPDDLIPYLHDIHLLVRSEAFNREMENFMAELQKDILNEIETEHNKGKTNGMRQLFFFIEGMMTRFRQMAAQYEELKKPTKSPEASLDIYDRGHT